MNKIVFGGAFDPIHNGHIEMARQTSNVLDADVIFVPSKNAVWKESSVSGEHKKKMVELAIKDNPRFSISDYELNHKADFVYTIETVQHMEELYPNDNFYLLIGYDQANVFHKWRHAKTLSEIAHIIVYKRPNYRLNKDNVKEYNMTVINDKELHDISSTEIREFKELECPISILNYIEENELYYIPKLKKWYKGRYNHVLGTANTAYEIAYKNGLDFNKAYIAGFLHDLGKMVDKDEYKNEVKSLPLKYRKYLNLPNYALHQIFGAHFANKEYGIKDKEILNSILFHCTGKDKMSWLDKVVYASDKIEPSRGYDSSDLINAMLENVDEGFITVLKANVEFINGKDNAGCDNYLSKKCVAYYLNQK